MADHQEVRDILTSVVETKIITADQVSVLEKFVRADWVIDANEAALLFKVNEALGSNHDDCPEWTSFFVTNICRLVVMDMNSPGQIDKEEGDWLEEMFSNYAVGNLSEDALIAELKKLSSSIDGAVSSRFESTEEA